jgi:hypothetical protein
MRTILTILFACLNIIIAAQSNGARSTGLGDLTLGLSDLFSAVHNQAMLPEIRNLSAGINVQNQYLVKNLSTASLSVAIPLGNGTAALNFSTFGYQLYRQNNFGLSYALAFSPVFSVGLRISYNSIQLGEGLGMEFAFYPDLGLNYKPIENLNISIQFQNLTLSEKVKQLDELWPVTGSLGLTYQINKKLLIGAQGNVYADQPFEINSGLEYQFNPHFSFRFGFASQPARASMGIGFLIKNIQIDLASSYQANLGFTPSFNLIYINGK